jgi:hypothetical protein
MTATIRLAGENLQCFSALWRFEQGQEDSRTVPALNAPESSLGSGPVLLLWATEANRANGSGVDTVPLCRFVKISPPCAPFAT